MLGTIYITQDVNKKYLHVWFYIKKVFMLIYYMELQAFNYNIFGLIRIIVFKIRLFFSNRVKFISSLNDLYLEDIVTLRIYNLYV
jgi:hypothetical protein